MIESFANYQHADSIVSDFNENINSEIRHWAMPNYLKIDTPDVAKEFVKPKYKRLSYHGNQNLSRMMKSLDNRGSSRGLRISSIWHSYTKNLF